MRKFNRLHCDSRKIYRFMGRVITLTGAFEYAKASEQLQKHL